MKIGIITFWQSQDNYGQILQCYALQRFLKKSGHLPTLIRYKETIEASTKYTISISKIFKYFTNFTQYYRYLKELINQRLYTKNNNNEKRDFDGFREKYISSTSNVYNEDGLILDTPQFDAYICGSDQIWGGRKEYYLSFVSADRKKIAYAPSFGGVNPFHNSNADDIKRYLGEFVFLSAREQAGVELLHEAGFNNARHVVDPTLLLDASDYSDLIADENCETLKSNDVFIYLLGNTTACDVKDIVKFIEKKHLSYTYVASQGRNDKFPKSYLSIPCWLHGIKESKLVITNSFHCIVFSLIFHRPFLFIPLSGGYKRMNDRLYDILGKCKLLDRIFDGDFSKAFDHVDFDCFDTIYAEDIEKSKLLLIDSLSH